MRSRSANLILVSIVLAACGNPDRELVDLDLEAPPHPVADEYWFYERRALEVPAPQMVADALDGDALAALTLADKFADANRTTEARYWYQVAAENGSAAAMNNLAIVMQRTNCRRAIYWFRKAVETDEFAGDQESAIRETLVELEASCE
jgi:TPR repeat protein